jgi:hypothetical protein
MTFFRVRIAAAFVAVLVLIGAMMGVSQASGGVQQATGVNGCPSAFPWCNSDPSAIATAVATNPLKAGPSANASLMAQSIAVARARGGRASAPADSILMRYGDVASYASDFEANGVVNPDRPVWVVTVHGDAQAPSIGNQGPTSVHVYSMIIDAQSGIASDWCYGCDLMTELRKNGASAVNP